MAIIKHLDKKYGVVYVYESVSYWDKDKKQPRSKRKLIGKIDPITGEIVPTGKRGRSPAAVADSPAEPSSSDPDISAGNEKADSYCDQQLEFELELELEHQDQTVSIQSEEYQALYLKSRCRLLETEAELAKANSMVSRLEAQKDEVLKELEQLAKKLRI